MSGRYRHPLFDRESPVVIGGDYITTESGTGLVHTAPGHGQEDYITGIKYGLPLLSPVDDEGNYTEDAGRFEGQNVLGEGNVNMIAALDESGALLLEEAYGMARITESKSSYALAQEMLRHMLSPSAWL